MIIFKFVKLILGGVLCLPFLYGCVEMEVRSEAVLPEDGSAAIIKKIRIGTNPIGVAVTHDNRYIYTANSGNNTVSKINAQTFRVESTLQVQDNPVWIGSSSAQATAYVTNRESKSLSVLDISGNYSLSTIDFNYSPEQIAVHPDGTLGLVTCSDADFVIAVDLINREVLKYITVNGGSSGVAFTPNGELAYVSTHSDRHNIMVISTKELTVMNQTNAGSSPSSIAIDSKGQYAYVVNKGSNDVSMIYVPDHHLTTKIPVGRLPIALSIAPSDRYIYVACQQDNVIDIIEAVTNKVVHTIKLDVMPWGVTCSQDGQYLFVANYKEKSQESNFATPGQPTFGTKSDDLVDNNNLLVIHTGKYH